MNPCPCGYEGHPRRPCECHPAEARRYRQRISGPLLDRIDLHVPVVPVDPGALASAEPEPSSVVRERVLAAARAARERGGRTGPRCNAELTRADLRVASVAPDAQRLLLEAMDRLALSARAHDRVLRVARTIADLAGEPTVRSEHVAEAVQYRQLDRAG
jgi:magnesium chelatase family protein